MRLTSLVRRLRARPVTLPPADPGAPEIHEAARRNRGSLQLRHVDAGSCNGCELEIASIFSPVYDAERFGMRLEASPRHADGLLVTGPVTRNMAEPLRKTLDAVPRPRVVVALGDCARNCGVFPRRLRRRRVGGRRRAGRPRDLRLPPGPRDDHHRVAGPGRYVTSDLLVATALAVCPPRLSGPWRP